MVCCIIVAVVLGGLLSLLRPFRSTQQPKDWRLLATKNLNE
jgi:hypothetical protein